MNPMSKSRNYQLSASLICADMLNLERELVLLQKGMIDYIHFDVMDGVFVPRFGLHPEMLKAVRSITTIPIDVHLMVSNPEPYIPQFADAGAQLITVHVEGNLHLLRTVALIRKCGVKPGVAVNPATPLEALECVIDEVDLILVMAINPGILGHALWPPTIRKIARLHERLGGRSTPIIQVDGGVTFESAPDMVRAGARLLVCGSSTIFRPESPIDQKLVELRGVLDTCDGTTTNG